MLAGPTAGIRCTDRAEPSWTDPIAVTASPKVAPQRRRRRVRSWPVPAGLPVTDRGQAPPLLGRGPGVELVAALLEMADDALAVLDGVVVVVLELGVHL